METEKQCLHSSEIGKTVLLSSFIRKSIIRERVIYICYRLVERRKINEKNNSLALKRLLDECKMFNLLYYFQSTADPCIPTNPCQNGATCVSEEQDGFRCECQPGFSGNLCQFKDVCTTYDFCKNGATCTADETFNGFTCTCAPGYSGSFCAVSTFSI